MGKTTKYSVLKNSVMVIPTTLFAALIVMGFVWPTQFNEGINAAHSFLTEGFGWLYLIAMFAFVVFAIYIAVSRFGKIKLGEDDSVPEHGTLSWFGMLFGAGMGIGLVFWGVAEPLNHYVAFGMTGEAADLSIRKAFLHWGLSPWAAYAVVGMSLGYFQYRKKSPGLISSIFVPLIGENGVRGPIGKAIDIIVVFATVAGMATSFGSGTLQINGGLNYLFGIPAEFLVQVVIVAVIAVVFIGTAVSGIDRGIKALSNLNMLLAAILVIGVFLVGPTLVDINIFTNGMGAYLGNFIGDSLSIDPFGDNGWTGAWTIFYWAWWISWSPYVGTFIARISKGRTLREFVVGVLCVPALASLVWFTIFGGLGLNLDNGIIVGAIEVTETALFIVLNEYPLAMVFSLVAIVLLVTFFATSANSGTFVLAMFSSGGDLNPGKVSKFVWGIVMAVLALVLLSTGGLEALKTASIVAAFPLVIVMLLGCGCLHKVLREDPACLKQEHGEAKRIIQKKA